ncbi:MFS transporter [Nocardia asiatica]|uniref:MFS transporter n=1 Tax=Nocardia asiatica TaxID=209252 RepID=UPI00030C7D18|nr:MFS transporter [Nocardia asiatica]
MTDAVHPSSVDGDSASVDGDSAVAAQDRRTGFGPLWAGETLSMFGSQITLVALPLTAVLVLNASPTTMGFLTAAGWLPIGLFGLVAGVWVDRIDQRRIMFVCNVLRAVSIGLIPVLAWAGQLSVGVLLVAAFATGCFAVFFDVAYQTIVPSLVEPQRLSWANSRLELSRSTAQLVGPALAGVLVAAASAPSALAVDAVSFAIAAVMIAFVPKVARSGDEPGTRVRVRAELLEGLRFVRNHRVLGLLIAAGASSNIFLAGVNALQFLFAVQELRLSTSVLGFAVGTMGAAALLGALLTTRINRSYGEPVTVIVGLALITVGATALALSAVFGGWMMFGLAQVLFGLSAPLVNISLVTLRQRITPRPVLGRVNAIARVCIMTSLPVGAVLAGLLAEGIGIESTIWVIAGGLAMVVIIFLRPMVRIKPSVPSSSAV